MTMTPMNPPRPEVVTTLEGDKVTSSQSMRYLGFTLVFLTVAPPLAVILWRIATMPWG